MKIILLAVLMFFIYDLNAEIIYVEPVQNAKFVSINNTVIIGFDKRIKNSNLNSLLTVTGSKSGFHTGDFIITKDKKRLIFKPHQEFAYNETVEVRLNGLQTSDNRNNKLEYTFQTQVRKLEPHEMANTESEDESPSANIIIPNSYSVLPQLTVTISNNPAPGRIFLNNFLNTQYTSAYLIIANNDGSIYHSKLMTDNVPDYKRQPNGLFTYFHRGTNKFYAEDTAHNVVDSFYCGNGYTTDSHELQSVK